MHKERNDLNKLADQIFDINCRSKFYFVKHKSFESVLKIFSYFLSLLFTMLSTNHFDNHRFSCKVCLLE